MGSLLPPSVGSLPPPPNLPAHLKVLSVGLLDLGMIQTYIEITGSLESIVCALQFQQHMVQTTAPTLLMDTTQNEPTIIYALSIYPNIYSPNFKFPKRRNINQNLYKIYQEVQYFNVLKTFYTLYLKDDPYVAFTYRNIHCD